jgi:hypothetical protein
MNSLDVLVFILKKYFARYTILNIKNIFLNLCEKKFNFKLYIKKQRHENKQDQKTAVLCGSLKDGLMFLMAPVSHMIRQKVFKQTTLLLLTFTIN